MVLPIDDHKDLDESVLKENKIRNIFSIGKILHLVIQGAEGKCPRM